MLGREWRHDPFPAARMLRPLGSPLMGEIKRLIKGFQESEMVPGAVVLLIIH